MQLLSCTTSDPSPNLPYCLPKYHKSGTLKGRPIVASLDGPSISLSKWMFGKLQPMLTEIEAHLVDGDQFVDRMVAYKFASAHISFGSLDVTNLYGSTFFYNVADSSRLVRGQCVYHYRDLVN